MLSDSTLRRRGPRPLSEKMRPGESPEAAAARAVREELGACASVRILGGADARVEEREFASYRGLSARYVLHAVNAEVVDGVPVDGELETEETGKDEWDTNDGAITVKHRSTTMTTTVSVRRFLLPARAHSRGCAAPLVVQAEQ